MAPPARRRDTISARPGAIVCLPILMSTSLASRITAVRPLWALEGGRVTIVGERFALDPLPPEVTMGGDAGPAVVRVVPRADGAGAAPASMAGRPPIRVEVARRARRRSSTSVCRSPPGCTRSTTRRSIAAGNLYVTFSGSRGQQPPVSVYKVGRDGARVPFVTDLSNATSLAFDREGRLHVSSRFDGSVHRVDARGRSKVVATDLGVACGIAFGPARRAVRRRPLRLDPAGRPASAPRSSRTLPPSVAAFHLAFGPDGYLYVAAPTISSSDGLYRISPAGDVEPFRRAVRPAPGHCLRLRRAGSMSSTRWLATPGCSGSTSPGQPSPSSCSPAAR